MIFTLSPIPAIFPIGSPGLPELLIFGTIALLLFGKRLPEVARSLGKGIVEFKKGVSGIEDEVHNATYHSGDSSASRPIARAMFVNGPNARIVTSSGAV